MRAVTIKGMSKSFGNTTALESIDLEIAQGDIFGLVGPDGAGKTTLIRLLCGILTPTSGEAEVYGADLRRDPEEVKKNIGYMSQRFSLYQDLSVAENMKFFENLYKVPASERGVRTARLLDFSRLGPFRDRPAGKLSGGMKQKLGLSCALIHTPKILFLDEPTTGVDPISRRELWDLLYELWEGGLTIVISTPYMDEAERCTNIALLWNGRVIAGGSPSHIISEYPFEMAEIVSESAQQLAGKITNLEGIKSVHQYGDRLHLALEDYRHSESRLKSMISSSGITDARLRKIRPSLEDVFLHMGDK